MIINKKTASLFLILCILGLSLIFLASCKAGKPSDQLTRINVACFPNITHAQALLLKEQGTLEKEFGEDANVNWIVFNAGPSEIEALFAGEIDIGYIGPVPALSGYIQSNGDLNIIAGASNGGSVLVCQNDADIQSAKDLAGKTVAIPQFGNTQHLSLLALLTANGLAPSSQRGNVNVVPASNADVANLMYRKNIDAALVPEPWGSILELNENGRVVLNYDEIDPNGIPSTAVVIVRKDFLDAHPDAVARFMSAHKAATVYINENLSDAVKIINNQIYKITQQPIEERVLESAFNRLIITYDIPGSSIMDFAQTCLNEKIITKLPDSKLINDAYVRDTEHTNVPRP